MTAYNAALRLAKRLASLPEPAMRRVAVGEALREAPPAEVVALLHELVLTSRVRTGPPWGAACEALATALGDQIILPYELRAALYAAAKEAALPAVGRLFFSALQLDEGDDEQSPNGRPVVPRGRVFTLGERKAMARGTRSEILLHLMRDPDQSVIRILLENPHVVERDVVSIAARRPTAASLLRAVFESRWLSRYAVKRTLIMNPNTPTDLAVRLIATMTEPDLRAVVADGNLAGPIRAQADALLAARRSGSATS